MAQNGENEIDLNVFSRQFKRKNSEAFETFVARDERSKNFTTNKNETLIKYKNLSKEIEFITAGYFDFNSMIWKDEIDGRNLKSTEWYKENSHYLREGYKSIAYII